MKKTPLRRKTPLSGESKFKRTQLNNKPIKNKRNGLKRSKRKERKGNPFWDEVIKTDRAFSQLIRLLFADIRGYVTCYTCQYRGFWKKGGIECGHFKGRTNMSTRWDKNNARPQCTTCNQVLGGNTKIFRIKLIDELGEPIVKDMESRSNKTRSLDTGQVKAIRLGLEKEVRKVRKKKKL